MGSFVVMMHRSSAGKQLTGVTLVHHADPVGVYQPRSVRKMPCSTAYLPDSTAFKHQDNKVAQCNKVLCCPLKGFKG